jgi:hypothetical protein
VSQDFDEIYLTFADYGKEWLGYIKETGKAAGFLTMKRYGPWHIDNPEDVSVVCQIILAFVIRTKDGN